MVSRRPFLSQLVIAAHTKGQIVTGPEHATTVFDCGVICLYDGNA